MPRRPKKDAWAVIAYSEAGWRVKDICNKLNCSRSWVYFIKKKFKETGTVENRLRSGRPHKISHRLRATIIKMVKGKLHISTRKIALKLKKTKAAKISHETVRKILIGAGLYPYHRYRAPKLTELQKNKRKQFAINFKDHDFTSTFFSDEKKFCLSHPRNSKNDIVWTNDPNSVPYAEEKKYDICFNVWGAISTRGKTKLAFYDGTLNDKKYQKILHKYLLPASKKLFKKDKWEFQQDGATPHTSSSTVKWIEDLHISFIPPQTWPPDSSDINPIEKIWGIMEEKLAEKQYTEKKKFRRAIQKIWREINNETLKKAIGSVSNILKEVRKQRGAHIKIK